MISKSLSHEEYLKKKRNKKLWKIGAVVFLLVLIVGIASYVSHRREIRISNVELNGGVLITQSDLESKTLTYLYGSYLWLFPKSNIFLYPHNKLEKYLKETFKRIDTVEVNKKGFHTLVVNIKERKPFAIWCYDPINSTTTPVISDEAEDCYFVDQNSTVFAKAPNFSGDAYFKYYGLISSADGLFIGKEYMSSTTKFIEISDFISKTKNLLIKPQYLIANSNEEFSLILSGGGEIYFDLRLPLSVVGQNLEALLKTPVFASSTGDLPVQYIDLRYGNKLFYKLK